MAYYAYDAGFCDYCSRDLGLVEQDGGRPRQYCDNACKQAAYREREREREKLNNVTDKALRYSDLIHEWRGRYGRNVGDLLQVILEEHGIEAARAAAVVAQAVVMELKVT